MQSNLMNFAMRHGVTLGILFSLNFILSTTGNSLLAFLGFVITGLIIYQTYRCTVQFRDKENGGAIKFLHAFTFVLFLFIFASIISSCVKFFYLKFFNTTYLDDAYNQNLTLYEQILPTINDQMYEALDFITTPQGFTMATAWSNVIIGIIFGLIIAAIVKKDKSPFDENSL